MKKVMSILLLITGFIVFTGCGDSATEIVGTLAIVQDIAIDTLASKGDTIFVTWAAMDTTLVDGYYLWTRQYIEGAWTLAAICDKNAGSHIANQASFYSVMAFKGTNSSSEPGISANTKTVSLEDMRQMFQLKPVGFIIDLEGDSLIAGDPASPVFAQQFVVAINFAGERYIYPGSAHSEIWPGGARTKISARGGFVAPSPDDSIHWKDSISYGGNFFLSLNNNYYCMIKGTSTLPDTATMSDTLVLRTQVQPIRGVRVFNEVL